MHHEVKGRARWVVVAFALVLTMLPADDSRGQSPFTFYRVDSQVASASFGDASWIDLDFDGDQDLLLVSSQGNAGRTPATRVFEQLSTIAVTTEEGNQRVTGEYVEKPVTNAPDLWLADIDWADFDLDGDLDAVVSGTAQTTGDLAPEFRILENDGSGLLVASSVVGVTPVLGTVRWVDIDNDGDSDLFTMGRVAGGDIATTIYRNDAATFSVAEFSLPAVSLGDARWADIDLDGDVDLALCGVEPGGSLLTAIYRNESGQGFTRIDAPLPGLAHCSLDWGDYDQDGLPDLLLSGGRTSHLILEGMTRVFRNAGGASFEGQSGAFRGVVGGTVIWIDVDSDGALDVIENGGTDLTFGRAAARIYRNEAGHFRHVSTVNGAFPGTMDPGDFDRDGDLDLMILGLDRDGMALSSIYLNGELVPNSPPSVPTGLQSSVSGGRATLSWSPADDEQTASAGLTYNLRVGTQPGLGDVVSVPVDDADRPLRSSRGNVGWSSSWTLESLQNGTYYWAVQAVDNSLSTSGFSLSQSFDITASSGTKSLPTENLADIPQHLHLSVPYPNPAAAVSTIVFDVPRASYIRLELFDSVGRRVLTLLDGIRSAGRHSLSWDIGSGGHHAVATGVYLLRLTSDTETRTSTVAIVR
jgi:hypothetical protein